jgi:hypothetical protein
MKSMTMYAILVTALVTIALIGYAAHAEVMSGASISGTGMISTKSSLINEDCGSLQAINSNTFGKAVFGYTTSVMGTNAMRDIAINGGKMVSSDSVVSMKWIKGNLTCSEDGSCTGTPSSYSSVNAGSNVYTEGVGSSNTFSALSPTAVTFNMGAIGYGSASQWADITDIKQQGGNTDCVGSLSTLKYSEVNKVIGDYNMSTKLTYTF